MSPKKEIKIDFSGFWDGLDKEENFFINTLREEFEPVITDKPDYLFYSVFSDDYLEYNKDVIRIFYTGECLTPDFNLADYAMGFDWIEFGDRYQRFPLYNLYGDEAENAAKRGGVALEHTKREKFCSFVCSNAGGDPFRQKFFEILTNVRQVDSGGRFLNNVGGPVEDKHKFEKEHRFSLCFENQSYPGYTTEKIIQAFAAGTIPIYWGDPEIGKVFNKKAFVCINDYGNPEDAIQRIIEIDNDSELFYSYLHESVFLSGHAPDIQKKEAQEFILNIFRNNREQAFRRNLTSWGINRERFYMRYSAIDTKVKKIKRIFNNLK